ncbi:MAG TPA: hypothetical protein VJM33_05465 [Microthrixaceae bacterium]|nr:hypothetical protein [Microthrixaceae bacterium]
MAGHRPATALRAASFVNAGWMAFVWVTRIRNAASDDEISSATRAGAYALSAACLIGAALLVWVGWRGSPLGLARIVVVAHGLVWVVRGLQIVFAGHDLAFVVVHEALAVISISLAAWLLAVTGGFRARGRASLRSAPLWDSP